MPHSVGTPALALSGADWRPALAVAAAVLLALFGGGTFEVAVAILAVTRTAWVYNQPAKAGKVGGKDVRILNDTGAGKSLLRRDAAEALRKNPCGQARPGPA